MKKSNLTAAMLGVLVVLFVGGMGLASVGQYEMANTTLVMGMVAATLIVLNIILPEWVATFKVLKRKEK